MVKLVIGLTGMIGAGKSAVSDHLIQKYNFFYISSGDVVRDELKTLGLEINRINAQSLAKQKVEEYGKDYWVNKILDAINNSNSDYAIFDGIRYWVDYSKSKELFGDDFILIQVDAPKQERFQRMKLRNRPGDPQTILDFEKQQKKELDIFDLTKIFENKDFFIDNSGSMIALKKKVDAIISLELGIDTQ